MFLLLAPTAAFADGVSPILNFFHKDTWMPASIITLAIILLESLLLWWRIKRVRFVGVLWRTILLNVASSLTGSVFLIAFSRDSFFMLQSMSLVLPLFLITLLTEIPLLHALFKNVPLSWIRAVILGCGINVASYVAVFVLEIGLLFGWIAYEGHLDKKDAKEWNNPGYLKQASGLIYAIESVGSKYRLRVFDPQNPHWVSLTNCPLLDPRIWDVEGDICAFIQGTTDEWKDRHLIVCRLPDFTTLLDLPPTQLAGIVVDNWQGVTDVAVSPDRKKLAVLFRQADAVAQRDDSSFYDLGSKCKLIVIDLVSGQVLARASRWASDSRLCWLSDSRRVLFSSFDDESVYQTTTAEIRGSRSLGIGHARDRKFKQSTYLFDVETASAAHFSDGCNPSMAEATGAILMRDQSGLMLVDSLGNTLARVSTSAVAFGKVVLSPSGTMILAEVNRHQPFYAGAVLVILSNSRPDVRHIVDDSFCYRIDWTTKRQEDVKESARGYGSKTRRCWRSGQCDPGPSWAFDTTQCAKADENRIEVLVCSRWRITT